MPKIYSILCGREIEVDEAEYARRTARSAPAAKSTALVERIAAMQAALAELLAEAQRVPAAPTLALVPTVQSRSNDATGFQPVGPLAPSDTRLKLRRDGQGRLTGAAGELRTSEGAVPVSMTVGARDPDGKLREIVLDGPAGKVRAIVHRSPMGEDHIEVIAEGPKA